jgi:hypothetical protein
VADGEFLEVPRQRNFRQIVLVRGGSGGVHGAECEDRELNTGSWGTRSGRASMLDARSGSTRIGRVSMLDAGSGGGHSERAYIPDERRIPAAAAGWAGGVVG